MVGNYMKKLISRDEGYKNDEWTFLSSKDCDLLDPKAVDAIFAKTR